MPFACPSGTKTVIVSLIQRTKGQVWDVKIFVKHRKGSYESKYKWVCVKESYRRIDGVKYALRFDTQRYK